MLTGGAVGSRELPGGLVPLVLLSAAQVRGPACSHAWHESALLPYSHSTHFPTQVLGYDEAPDGELRENEFGFRKRSGEAALRKSSIEWSVVRSARHCSNCARAAALALTRLPFHRYRCARRVSTSTRLSLCSTVKTTRSRSRACRSARGRAPSPRRSPARAKARRASAAAWAAREWEAEAEACSRGTRPPPRRLASFSDLSSLYRARV